MGLHYKIWKVLLATKLGKLKLLVFQLKIIYMKVKVNRLRKL